MSCHVSIFDSACKLEIPSVIDNTRQYWRHTKSLTITIELAPVRVVAYVYDFNVTQVVAWCGSRRRKSSNFQTFSHPRRRTTTAATRDKLFDANVCFLFLVAAAAAAVVPQSFFFPLAEINTTRGVALRGVAPPLDGQNRPVISPKTRSPRAAAATRCGRTCESSHPA